VTVQRIDRTEVAARAVTILGLDHEVVDLVSTEALCASLRRTASFLCPASPRQIVDAVMNALTPLADDLERETVVEALDALLMSGDLLELRQPEDRARLLFLGPPSFVEKHPGEYLLLGIRPRSVALVDETAEDIEVVHDAHARSVLLDPASGAATLVAAGLHRVSKEQWTKAPRTEPCAQVVDRLREQLAAERAPGAVTGLTIIDPSQPMHYYKGRWREPAEEHTGIFTGRRPQAYGAPIWCAVEMAHGVPQSVLDLPVDSNIAPGWDEARRIQAALDAENDTPQAYRVRTEDPAPAGSFFDFFAPLPTWAERYLAISGWPAPKGPKSLFSYCVPHAAVSDAEQFLTASLWMAPIKEDQ
jgi:hypothetical protein